MPAADGDFVAAVLEEHYDIRGAIEPLPGERDRNHAVATPDGRRYVIKFTSAAQSDASVDMQTLAMTYLARELPDLPMPRVIATTDGASSLRITLPSGTRHVVRLLTWLDGIPMDEAQSTRNMAQPIGQWLARIDRALLRFTHPGAEYALLWDVQNARYLRALLPCISETSLNETCRRCLDLVEQNVPPALARLPQQIIFGDLHPGNVLVAAQDPQRLAGIIDFGDMVRSYRIIDVAVACAYFCRADDQPFAPAIDLLHSYAMENPLLAEEVGLLPELIMARLLTTALIAHWRASLFPENREYIMGSAAHARALLERMSPGALDQGRAQMLEAIPTGRPGTAHEA